MTEVATDLNIKAEAELFDYFARYGVSKATFEFYTDIFYHDDISHIEVHPWETELHGNIPDEIHHELYEAFNEFAETRANEVGKTAEDETATLTYDVATRQVILEGDFEGVVHIREILE